MQNTKLTTERWRQVKETFQTAIELPTAERATYLTTICSDDLALRSEVESLIAAHNEPGSFLDSPAFDLATEPSALAGKFLGHYQILSLLNRGGMGQVYRAKDTTLGREVAIKVLPCDFSVDPDRLRRFEQEARAASALNHPNIITIHEFGQEDSNYFIVTELIEGQTLRQRMAGEGMSADDVMDIAIQIASALNAAHEAGIVHRDLKPENVMVRPDGLVKVLDFGLAKLTESRRDEYATVQGEASTIFQGATQTGVVMGTVNYMSPEQARGQKLDARTDLFSLGVLLYEMAAGRSPFARETVADAIASILEKEPPPLAPEIPETLERVIFKALRKDREARYQTAKELLADLKSLKSGDTAISAPRLRKFSGAIKRRWLGAAAAPLAMAALIAVAVYYKNHNAIESIAVLPLVNADGNPETEYLADSITETITNYLSRFPSLEVRPRNSALRYKKRGVDPRAAGRELNVEAVLTGEVTPRGEELSISLELIDVHENRQLWGARYQRRLTDLLAVQADITRQIVEQLRLRLPDDGRPPIANRYTDNFEAYQAYLRGRYFWNKRNREGIEKAIGYFNQAIAIAPRYALAYAGLADCQLSLLVYGMAPAAESFAKSKEAARNALAIDDTLAEAHTTLAHITWLHEWNWAEAERGFKRAIALNPKYPTAHQWYAIYLSSMARHEEAIAEIKRAQALDPLSAIVGLDVARTFYFARQYDQAIEQYHKAVEFDPGFQALNTWLRLAYEQKGLYDKAVEENLKALTQRGTPPEIVAAFKKAYAAAGWQGYWQKQLELSTEELKKRPVSPYFMAEIHARLGNNDQTLDWLEKAYEKHSDYLVRLKADPMFDGLRNEPRFAGLLRRIGLTP